jgi:hypothetical protein
MFEKIEFDEKNCFEGRGGRGRGRFRQRGNLNDEFDFLNE